jgi:hypothetical protein
VKRFFFVVFLVLMGLPSAGHAATPYYWEKGCFTVPLVQRCWATNFDPNAGFYGSQSRTDNLHSLPTWNGQLSYGSPSLNNATGDPHPSLGGDYPRGGGNAFTSSDCVNVPSNTACNWSPSQFVTQNYVDSSGAWHFAMGGARQCMSDGVFRGGVVCNLRHQFHPYDCARPVSAYCSSTTPLAMPFSWGFPSSMYFEMRTNLYVGGVAGPFHAWLCASLFNANQSIELCEEPWNSTGGQQPAGTSAGISCNPHNPNTFTYFQRPGIVGPYMSTTSPSTTSHKTGVTIPVRWTMSRTQFINLLTAAGKCGAQFRTDMDNWKLYYSQNGIETAGPAGQGAGVNWQIWDETMITWY